MTGKMWWTGKQFKIFYELLHHFNYRLFKFENVTELFWLHLVMPFTAVNNIYDLWPLLGLKMSNK
jgi:hypothetical protein